jgi:hypothetical protein
MATLAAGLVGRVAVRILGRNGACLRCFNLRNGGGRVGTSTALSRRSV